MGRLAAAYAQRIRGAQRHVRGALCHANRAREQADRSGRVVAAYAHEMGTPLATITLVSQELADELAGNPDPHLQEDARISANRRIAIATSRSMPGKDDTHLRTAPLEAVIREATSRMRRAGSTSSTPSSRRGRSGRCPAQIWRKPG